MSDSGSKGASGLGVVVGELDGAVVASTASLVGVELVLGDSCRVGAVIVGTGVGESSRVLVGVAAGGRLIGAAVGKSVDTLWDSFSRRSAATDVIATIKRHSI